MFPEDMRQQARSVESDYSWRSPN